MSNDLSEECKERLRDIDGHLTHIFSDPALVTPRLTLVYPRLLNLIIAAHDDVDDRCREVLRGIEPEIQYLIRAREKDTSGTMMPNERLVETLRSLHTEFQDIVHYRLTRRTER
jgi:hypothetical protein